MPIAYANDAKTFALYNLSMGGANLAGNVTWDLSPVAGGGYQRVPTLAQVIDLAADWTIERSLSIPAGAGPGTIIELGGWGETEQVNIQVLIGWDASRRLYVAWETGAGVDHQLVCDDPLPADTDLSIAVTRTPGHAWIAVNGVVWAEAWGIPDATSGSGTTGLTLSVGRRVSTSDPQVFSGGGWLRISQPRSQQEIHAAWEAAYPAPAPAGATFAELEQGVEADAYWVLRGTIGPDGAEEPFAWATAPIATAAGPLEARLVEPPSSFQIGLTDAVGAIPPRISIDIVVANHDGALDPYLVGGGTPQTEYTEASFYSIKARLYQGFVDATGATHEEPWTPTLVVSGGFSQANGLISMQLASQDKRLFGRSRRIRTVRQLQEAELVPGTLYAESYLVIDEADTWEEIRSSWTENLDALVPWGYGRPLIPLMRVSAADVDRAQFIACCSATKIADPQLPAGWTVYGERNGMVEELNGPVAIGGWMAQVDTEDEDGNRQQLWVYGATTRVHETFQRLWIVPKAWNLLGVAEWEPMTAPDVIRAIVEDHSEAGAAGIDADSFNRAATALAYTSGAIGGLFGTDGGGIGDVLPLIAEPVGLGMWLGADDKLHLMLPGTWTAEDAVAAQGALPVLLDGDVLPSSEGSPESTWSETAPGDAEDYGAPAAWILMQWASDQVQVFPPSERPESPDGARMTGAKRTEVRTEVEVVWRGDWIYPPAAVQLFDGVAAARAFPTRSVSCVTNTWVARLGVGSLVRARHSQGMGYDGQSLRLLRATIIPGEHVAECVWEDTYALELMKRGVLDSEEHWVLYDPADDGVTIVIDQGSDKILLSESVADPSWEKASLWTFGATDPHLRRSWRIVEVVDGSQIRVEPTPDASDVITAAASPAYHRAPWVVMTNAIHAGHDYRPDKIRDCDEQAQTFTDGEPGFQF